MNVFVDSLYYNYKNISLKFSFIIPTFNRTAQLHNCVMSINSLDYDHNDFEIIVVNDGGKEPESSYPFLKLLTKKNEGPAIARNFGASLAEGEYLIFIDDDCCLDSNWLNEISSQCKPKLILTGNTINKANSWWSDTSQNLVNYLHEVWKNTPWHFFASNNLVVNKKDFILLNGFDTSFPIAAGEDRAFCFRAKKANFEFKQIDTAIVYHFHFLNLFSFLKQHFNYGKGAFFFNKVLQQHQVTLPVQPFSFYKNMLKYPFFKYPLLKGLIIMFMICSSQLFNILGYLSQKKN